MCTHTGYVWECACVFVCIIACFHVSFASVNYESKAGLHASVSPCVCSATFPTPTIHTHSHSEAHRILAHSRGSLMTTIPLCATLLISSMILGNGTCTVD